MRESSNFPPSSFKNRDRRRRQEAALAKIKADFDRREAAQAQLELKVVALTAGAMLGLALLLIEAGNAIAWITEFFG